MPADVSSVAGGSRIRAGAAPRLARRGNAWMLIEKLWSSTPAVRLRGRLLNTLLVAILASPLLVPTGLPGPVQGSLQAPVRRPIVASPLPNPRPDPRPSPGPSPAAAPPAPGPSGQPVPGYAEVTYRGASTSVNSHGRVALSAPAGPG